MVTVQLIMEVLGAIGFNGNDGFRLVKGVAVIDEVKAPNDIGYYLKRKITNLNPNTVFTEAEWRMQALSEGQCLAGIGALPLIRTPPTITLSPQYVINCGVSGATLTAAGAEGVVGLLPLSYQWYVLQNAGSWTAISNGGIYAGATSSVLTVSDIEGLEDFQYYCQIQESGATCYTATNSAQLRSVEKIWDGTNWLDRNNVNTTAPTATEKIKLNASYSTLVHGNLSGCSLINNGSFQLTISENRFANIEGKIANNGSILVESYGSLLQKNNAATFTGNPITAKRDLIVSGGRQQYNYLISPVIGQSLKTIYAPNPLVLYHNEVNNKFYTSSGAYI